MTREECERIIADKMAEIVDAYLEYYPEADYLSMCFLKSENGNGNDFGDWDTYKFDAHNAIFKGDEGKRLDVHCHKDIKDAKYWKCNTEESDKTEDDYAREQGTLLPSGWNICSW